MLVFVPIMLALCSMLAAADYAKINARLIDAALTLGSPPQKNSPPCGPVYMCMYATVR